MAQKIIFRKGQLAIWVIISIVIVAVIGTFFIIQKKPTSSGSQEFDVHQFIVKCTAQHADEALNIMLPQGGFIAPQDYKRSNYTDVVFLCKNIGYFKPCINQHPLLIKEMSEEIQKYIEPRIEQCFSLLQEELKRKNYEVQLGGMELKVSLAPETVYIDIARRLTLAKDEYLKTIEEFPVIIKNPVYDLGTVAQIIASQESTYCYFEYLGYSLLYPRWDIRKFTMSDATKIYTIMDKKTNKFMNIAIRGCAIPPGI